MALELQLAYDCQSPVYLYERITEPRRNKLCNIDFCAD
jgi:hypothetical protein